MDALSRNQGRDAHNLWPQVSGPYLTLGTLAVAELLARMLPVPNPAPVVLLAVVYAALSGGLATGFLSAGMALGYYAYFYSAPGELFRFLGNDLHSFGLLAVTTPAMVLMVGALKRRAARAHELQSANERLRELDQLKTQFLNNAAHELRTPLTPIKLQMHLLKTSRAGPVDERQQKALHLMDRNIERLNVLVQDLLEVARLQAGKLTMQKQRTDLHKLIDEAVESFRESALLAGVALEHGPGGEPLVADADPKRVIQVMFNLLNNAIKFTPAGGRVSVEASRSGDAALVRVRDSGRGLQGEDIPRLFTPFTQVHGGLEVTQPGSGLGLYICRGIVEQHGGRIWAESPGLGKGSTFSFALPLAAPPQREDVARTASPAWVRR